MNIKFEFLNSSNVNKYIDYLKVAVEQEPDFMFCDFVDEVGIKNRVNDYFYSNTKSILAIVDEKVVGRIEYHFYGCLQDGYRMCYVDWVYVLKDFRNKGIGKKLFLELEKECERNNINQYYLLCATNEFSKSFYNSLKRDNVEIVNFEVFRKNL